MCCVGGGSISICGVIAADVLWKMVMVMPASLSHLAATDLSYTQTLLLISGQRNVVSQLPATWGSQGEIRPFTLKALDK